MDQMCADILGASVCVDVGLRESAHKGFARSSPEQATFGDRTRHAERQSRYGARNLWVARTHAVPVLKRRSAVTHLGERGSGRLVAYRRSGRVVASFN